jgi:hypothetical protein
MTRAGMLSRLLAIAICVHLTGCGARQCRDVQIVVTSHPSKPRPSGRVLVGCDGKVLVDVEAERVQ